MSNFKSNTVILGEVPERVTIKANFQVISNKEIVRVVPSCGCTPAKFNKKSLEISYRTGDVPVHLQHYGKSSISKFTDVFFSDGTKERVYLQAILIRNENK